LKLLNLSPIQFNDQEIRVGRLRYGSDGAQVLRELRDGNRGTHVIRREGPDSILAVSIAPGAVFIGEPETVRLSEHLELAAELVRNSLLNGLAALGRTSRGYDPIEVVSRKDLLRISCPSGIEPPEWLAVRILYEVTVRPICFGNRKRLIAAMLNVRTTRVIDRTVADLTADGVCLTGTYVRRKVPSKDFRIEPKFETLGCGRFIESSRLLLTDSRDGIDAVEASEVWPVQDLFDECLEHVFRSAHERSRMPWNAGEPRYVRDSHKLTASNASSQDCSRASTSWYLACRSDLVRFSTTRPAVFRRSWQHSSRFTSSMEQVPRHTDLATTV
jgi:hypothetical protein